MGIQLLQIYFYQKYAFNSPSSAHHVLQSTLRPTHHFLLILFQHGSLAGRDNLPTYRPMAVRRATPRCRPRAISVAGFARFTLPPITCGSSLCLVLPAERSCSPSGRTQLLPSPDVCSCPGSPVARATAPDR
jgi:hypothetical protein